MPRPVIMVMFNEDERRVFERVASLSILGESAGEDKDARLRYVRRAAREGETFSRSAATALKLCLEGAVADRERNIEALQQEGMDDLVAGFAQWLNPLGDAWSLAADAESIALGGLGASLARPLQGGGS